MPPLTICLVICALTIISYIWGKLSMACTALLSITLFVVSGCLPAATAAANFGNTNAILMVGMFVVAAGFNRTQLVNTVASSVNRIAKGSLVHIMAGYVLVTMLLAQFIRSSMVAYGIVVPMIIASCRELKIHPSKVAFPIGMIAIVTCATMPVGGGAGQYAEMNGYIESVGYEGFSVGFLDPMKARLPLLIVLCLYAIFFATKFSPDQPTVATGDVRDTRDKREALPPFQEKCGYIIMIAVILGFLLSDMIHVATWVIAMTGAVLVVATGVLKPKEALDAIPWWIIFVYVGALCMGNALSVTGAGDVVGQALSNSVGSLGNGYLIGAVFFVIPFLLTQVMMNNAVITIFAPIAVLAAKAMGANPVPLVMLVTAGSLSSFMSPMATPTVPMAMALGGYDLKSVLKQSIVPALICCIISVLWIVTVFPL